MLLIVGLGNPGIEYVNTRHNIGSIAVDILSDRYNFTWKKKTKFNSKIAIGEFNSQKLILSKPNIFMNLSGEAVLSLVTFYKLHPKNIIVLHDDIDIAFGRIGYKFAGGSGGHNGIKSINKHIGNNYHRLRIGIGRPEDPRCDIANFVLSKFSNQEESRIQSIIYNLIEILPLIYQNDLDVFKKQLSILNK